MFALVLSLLLLLPVFTLAAGSAPGAIPLLNLTSSVAAAPSVRLSLQPPIPFQLVPPPPSTPVLSLDLSQRFQSLLLGFGGAFTQAAGSQYALLSPALQAELVRAYFHPTEGHAYNIGRVPINSCDYSQFSYSYDDTPDDFNLTSFDRSAKVDSVSIIPLIQAAQAMRGERLMLYAAPWSPPAWMKQSGQMNGSSDPCLKVDLRVHQAWAQYFVEWLLVYQKAQHILLGTEVRRANTKGRAMTEGVNYTDMTVFVCCGCVRVVCAAFKMSQRTIPHGKAASSVRRASWPSSSTGSDRR